MIDLVEYISSGHTPYKHDMKAGDVKFITVECIDGITLNEDKLKRITSEQYENEFKNNRVVKNSIVCTIKRRICKAFAFADEPRFPLAMNQDVAFFIPKTKINSTYLATYLSCKIGQTFANRQKTEQINPYISVANLSSLPIFLCSDTFQLEIERLVKSAHAKLEESKTLYAEAEKMLLDELGLSNWQPSTENVAVKSLKESFLETGRLDAEFYQPKYDELKEIIRTNAKYVRDVSSIAIYNQRGEQPRYVANGDLRVINSKHILEQHLDYDNFERTSSNEWNSEPTAQVFKNDILIYTTGANVGRTNVYLSDEKALASNHVNILRVENENAIYVSFVLNSLVGRMQTRQIITGSAQAELYSNAIAKFIVPFVDKSIQEKIIKNVQESFFAQNQSKQLLELAKHAVEVAIEQDENVALAMIKEKTN